MAQLMGNGPRTHDAHTIAVEARLDGVIGDDHGTAGSRGIIRVVVVSNSRGEELGKGIVPIVWPNARSPAGDGFGRVDERDQVHDSVIVPGVGYPVRPIVVELGEVEN